MQALGLLAPGVMLDHPFFRQVPQGVQTPASSADEADLGHNNVIKSPLAKHDQMSVALPSDSEDSAAPAVDSPAAVDQPPATCPPPAAGAYGRGGPEPWLMGLFNASLFDHHGCRCHPGTVRNGTVKKNENNQYCLSCTHMHGTGMCKLCLPAHTASCSDRVFQIRKYMYQTCVHVDDIQPLYDVGGVQAYCINSRRAVLIHPKNVEQEQKCPAFDHACIGCHKPLRHDCTYCSLRCKVDVEYGFAPITPKGSAAAHNISGGPAAVAAAVAAVLAAQPRQPPGSRPGATKRQACTTTVTLSSLDVSHATLCSSGGEGSSRSKRRKAGRPERSFFN